MSFTFADSFRNSHSLRGHIGAANFLTLELASSLTSKMGKWRLRDVSALSKVTQLGRKWSELGSELTVVCLQSSAQFWTSNCGGSEARSSFPGRPCPNQPCWMEANYILFQLGTKFCGLESPARSLEFQFQFRCILAGRSELRTWVQIPALQTSICEPLVMSYPL